MHEKEETAYEVLRDLCNETMEARVGTKSRYIEQLNWELDFIKGIHAENFFLKTRDLMNLLNVTPYQIGYKGYVGASLVAYFCDITCVDPVKVGLWPEFFMHWENDEKTGYLVPAIRLLFPEGLNLQTGNLVFNSRESISTGMVYDLVHRADVDFNVTAISLSDITVADMFEPDEKEKYFPYGIAAYGIPEFRDKNIIEIVKVVRPELFEDIVKILCIANSDGVWNEDVIAKMENHSITIDNLLCSGEDVYAYLMKHNIPREIAFDIVNRLRNGKGKHLSSEQIEIIKGHTEPWFFNHFIYDVKLLPSRAWAYRKALDCWWLAWAKINYPKEFEGSLKYYYGDEEKSA